MPIEILDEPTPIGKAQAKAQSDDDLQLAMEVIREQIAAGRKFTNEQRDVFTSIIIDVLEKDERDWFKEIAEQNNNYLWVVLMCQWRRSQEQGESAACSFIDPNWPQERV